MKRMKEIVAFVVLICLLLASIQTVLADGPVYASLIYGPFIAPGPMIGNEPLSPFDATFIQITEASVSLSSEKYTFEIIVTAPTPSGWMTSNWQPLPTFAAPHETTKLSVVGYNWILYDALGHYLGVLHFAWEKGIIVLEVWICPASANFGCIVSMGSGKGLGSVVVTLDATMSSVGSDSVSVTISQSYLNELFTGQGLPNPPGEWRALAAGCHMASSSANSCTGYITYPRANLPTDPP